MGYSSGSPHPVAYDALAAQGVPSQGMFKTWMNQPAFIQTKNLKFLILDAPHPDNLHRYIEEFKKYNVSCLVRTCEQTYSEELVAQAGIQVRPLVFADGEPPTAAIIQEWMSIVREAARNDTTAAVHCLAGLGRAPVLVVIALVEYGMSNLDAIELVRSKRRGNFATEQITFFSQGRSIRNNCNT